MLIEYYCYCVLNISISYTDMQSVNIFIKNFWKVWINEISKDQNKDKNWHTKISIEIYLLSYK